MEPLSSNQLDGFTQTTTAFKLTGVHESKIGENASVFVVDTPGFADAKISQLEIVSMVSKWMQDNETGIDCILYFTPINSIRLPGSHRHVLKTFQALAGIASSDCITIVTSMWDLLAEERQEKAEVTFRQLRDEIWKPYTDQDARITKFYNSQDSALQILNEAFKWSSKEEFGMQVISTARQPLRTTQVASNLFEDLQTRTQNLRLRKADIELQLADPSTRKDNVVALIMQSELEDVKWHLEKFEKQEEDFICEGKWALARRIAYRIKKWGLTVIPLKRDGPSFATPVL